ncbi:hypothetical protein F5050DRAFT_1758248 [Lentinula boryana]|uniref:Protein kinase domain-containing protein n=1 Tax=Lentinula boryana TaxID=40481 RepID=A0ABQ8QDH4_9AGAR|nr:hypothetical protein F5050DRAFT_1758248 [Lentinula boryana]
MRILYSILSSILATFFISAYAAPPRNLDLDQRGDLPTWIQGEVDNPSFFTKKDQQAFSKQLWNVRLGERLPVGGQNNFAVYSLKGYGLRFKSNTLIMKVFNTVNNAAIGEAKALNAVGDLVASGTVKALDSKPAIIMKKKPGQPLHETQAYKAAREIVREKMRSQTYELMCNEISAVATKKYVLHDDNNPANILVTMDGNTVKSVAVVDYGPPQTYFVSKSVTKADVLEYCGKHPSSKQYLWEQELIHASLRT